MSNTKLNKEVKTALGYLSSMDTSIQEEVAAMKLKSCGAEENCEEVAKAYVHDMKTNAGMY